MKKRMNTDEKKALIILAMHKSGASVLGGCLDLLGMNPENSQVFGNRSGYGANRAIMIQHEILLNNLGCRWDMVGSLPRDWLQSRAAKDAGEKISGILDTIAPANGCIVINDPRICRLMPLWTDILGKKQISPRFVFLVRHPCEAAMSLMENKGVDLLKGHLLWLVHNRDALEACRENQYVVISYDSLLEDPVYCMDTIGDRLGIVFPRMPEQAYSSLINFVRPDLKHHHESSGKNSDKRFYSYELLYNRLKADRSPAPEGHEQGVSTTGAAGADAVDGQIEISEFPLVAGAGAGTPDIAHITEMFDDILEVLRSFEQDEIDREARRERLLLEADYKDGVFYTQVYFPENRPGGGEAYTPENSRKILLAPDSWQKLSVFIAQPHILSRGRLRIDPFNARGTINISAVNLADPSSGDVLWSASGSHGFSGFTIEGQSLYAGTPEKSIMLYATGTDTRILLPVIDGLPDLPVNLEIWIKATPDLTHLNNAWEKRESRISELKQQVAVLSKKLEDQQNASDEQIFELLQDVGESRQEVQKKDDEAREYYNRLMESEKRVEGIWKKVREHDERVIRYSSELAESERRLGELYGWFVRLADLLGFDETTASSSLHLVKKSSRVFSRKAPVDEIQTVFRNFYSMMPAIDAAMEAKEENREKSAEQDAKSDADSDIDK